MEAIPKLPMISFPAKVSPDNSELNTKLKQLITEKFGENPSAFGNEIKEFETLRANTCIRTSENIDGVAALKKYYCQVVFLKNRFKIPAHVAFPFSWNELYNGTNFASTDIDYELASVLYNIGALHSRLGASECRDEADGMKMAVAHFQCAAWAFHSQPDLYPQDVESDLNSDLMGIKSQISLAQAQECILEKSILDNRKPTIISKVGGQVVEYYKQALKSIQHSNSKEHGERIIDIIGNRQQIAWAALIEFKIKYYTSLSLLHMGMLSEENQKMGERVAYYQAASDNLTEAAKLSKKLDSGHKSVSEPLMYASDVVNGKLDNAKKENEFIYHEKVPSFESLPEIKGASLVKGIPFDVSDPEVSGKDIFDRLVPLEAHEASSLYSEEQAKLLRTILSETEGANNELTVYMSALQLEDIPSEDEYINIPQQLIECAAGLSLRTTAVAQLQEGMASLASVSADVEASLIEIHNSLTQEKDKEKQFQDVVGPRPSPIITELEKETQKYQEAHSMASESNLTLNKAMRLHVKNLQLLSKPMAELEKEIPQISSLDDSVLHSLTSIKEIISKVEEMRTQRQQLLDNLREAIKNDDITNSLASKGNKDTEKVFEEELKKHQTTVDYIRQNIRAQNNILAALTEKNAEYAVAREKIGTFVRDRNEMIGGLVASFHVYEDLLDKTTKGLEFYARLEQNVSKLSSRVEGVIKVQEEERDQLISTSNKKIAEARELSLALISGQTPSQFSKSTKPSNLTIPEYKPEFAPGAPPPDTPENPVLPAPTSKPNRPKLKDYLMARKEGSKDEKDVPGVRLPPVGSESEPVNPTHSAPSVANFAHMGYPGAVPGMGHPGMMYPQNFYQNPQFAAMYAQSLNMVKGLQGGGGPPSLPSVVSQPSSSASQQVASQQPPSSQNQPSSQSSQASVHTTQAQAGTISSTLPQPSLASGVASQSFGTSVSSQQMSQAGSVSQPVISSQASMNYSYPNQQPQHQQYPGFPQAPQSSRGVVSSVTSTSTPSVSQPPATNPPTVLNSNQPNTIPSHVQPTSSVGQNMANFPQQQIHPSLQHQQQMYMQQQQQFPNPQGYQMQMNRAYLPQQQHVSQNPQIKTQPQANTPNPTGSVQSVPSATLPTNVSSAAGSQAGAPSYMPGTQPGQVTSVSAGQPYAPRYSSPQHKPQMQAGGYSQQGGVIGPSVAASMPNPVNPNMRMMNPVVPQPGSMQHKDGLMMNQNFQQMNIAHTSHAMSTQQQFRGGQENVMSQNPQIRQAVPAVQPAGNPQGLGQYQGQQIVGQTSQHPSQNVNQIRQPTYQVQPGQMNPGMMMRPAVAPPGQMPPGQAGSQMQQAYIQHGQTAPGVMRPGAPTGVPSAKQASPAQFSMVRPQQGYMQQQQQRPAIGQPGVSASTRQTFPGSPSISQPGAVPIGSNYNARFTSAGIPMPSVGTQGTPQSVAGIYSNTSVAQPRFQQPGQVNVSQPGVHPGVNMQQVGVQHQVQANVPQPGAPHVYQTRPQVPQPQVPLPPASQPGVPASQFPNQLSGSVQQPVLPQQHVLPPQPGVNNQNQTQPNNENPPHGTIQSSGNGPSQQVTSEMKPDNQLSNLDLLAGLKMEEAKEASVMTNPAAPPPGSLPAVSSVTAAGPGPNLQVQPQHDATTRNNNLLSEEMNNLDSIVSNLDTRNSQGFINIDLIWKNIQDAYEKDVAAKKLSVSVARCYPNKNRSPDVLPFDQTRVELKNTKDDYINASSITNLTDTSPGFVLTQLPVRATVSDLLHLVWQEGIETMASLVPLADMGEGNYVPPSRESLTVDVFTVTCQSLKETACYRERVLNICNSTTKQTRAILHIEMTGWVGPDLPTTPDRQLLPAALRVLQLNQLQRYPGKPVLLHCKDGGSKSATLSLILAGISQLQKCGRMADTVNIFCNLMQARKGVIRDKVYVRFYLIVMLAFLRDKLGVSQNTGGNFVNLQRSDHVAAQQPPSQVYRLQDEPQAYSLPTADLPSTTDLTSAVSQPASNSLTADMNTVPDSVVPVPVPGQITAPDGIKQEGETVSVVDFIEDDVINVEITETPAAPSHQGNTDLQLMAGSQIPSELTSLDNLSLTDSPSRRRISKQDFANPGGSLRSNLDSADPLSQLDPLWSLGKK